MAKKKKKDWHGIQWLTVEEYRRELEKEAEQAYREIWESWHKTALKKVTAGKPKPKKNLKIEDVGLSQWRRLRKIQSTKFNSANYKPVTPGKRGSHFGGYTSTDEIPDRGFSFDIESSGRKEYKARMKKVSKMKIALGRDITTRLLLLSKEISPENLKFREDAYDHTFNRVLRDAKRLIKLWDNNQKLIDDLREFGANKITLKDLIFNPTKLRDYYEIQKKMNKILKATLKVSNRDLIKAMYSRAHHQAMIDRLEEFLIGTEQYAKMWDEAELDAKRMGISLKEYVKKDLLKLPEIQQEIWKHLDTEPHTKNAREVVEKFPLKFKPMKTFTKPKKKKGKASKK